MKCAAPGGPSRGRSAPRARGTTGGMNRLRSVCQHLGARVAPVAAAEDEEGPLAGGASGCPALPRDPTDAH